MTYSRDDFGDIWSFGPALTGNNLLVLVESYLVVLSFVPGPVGVAASATLATIAIARFYRDPTLKNGVLAAVESLPLVARLIKFIRGVRLAKGRLKFPGKNPAKPPKGFEWRGKPGSKPGSKDGNWYNPRTGESLRPDLDHPGPIGPHWDYRDPSGNWHRIFPDGSQVSK